MITSRPASQIKPNSQSFVSSVGKGEDGSTNGKIPENAAELFTAQAEKVRAQIRARRERKAAKAIR